MNRKLTSTILQISGATLICFGAGMLFLPAGIILAGAFAVLFGIALERGDAE